MKSLRGNRGQHVPAQDRSAEPSSHKHEKPIKENYGCFCEGGKTCSQQESWQVFHAHTFPLSHRAHPGIVSVKNATIHL